MGTTKIRGIVIKERITGEANKQIVVLAKEHGKMLLGAKGAKNLKSKLLAGTQLFAYCDFLVYEGKGFLSISQAELIESFYPLRLDLLKLSYAVYLLELIEKTIPEGIESDEVLLLLLRTLSILSKSNFDIRLAVCIFELKYMQFIGFMPEIENCCRCGKERTFPIIFHSASGGVLCKECAKKAGEKAEQLLPGTFQAMEYILNTEEKALFRFQVSEEVLKQMEKIEKEYIQMHVNEKFSALEFAEEMNKK